MGCASRAVCRWGISVLVLIAGGAATRADVTTDHSSSVLIFPKLIFSSSADPPVDTIIQISNTSNQMVFAHCFYVNTVPLNPTLPPSANNPLQWQEVDFQIFLTKQQPTHWVISAGRRVNPSDPECTTTLRNCDNAGFDPDTVPPVADPFIGELKCVEVDSSGSPISGNHLKGEVTIVTEPDGDASKYNAIGVLGNDSNDSDDTLCLGGDVTDVCPSGAEYDACPQTVILNHFASGAPDPVIEELGNGPSTVTTILTLVPCSEDFENLIPGHVVVQFVVTNEFEEMFSASTTVDCFVSVELSRISPVFTLGYLRTQFVQTRMSPASADQSGFIGVAEEVHTQSVAGGTASSSAALNLHVEGERPQADIIRLPEDF
jgi:hypothetical protein